MEYWTSSLLSTFGFHLIKIETIHATSDFGPQCGRPLWSDAPQCNNRINMCFFVIGFYAQLLEVFFVPRFKIS